MTFKMAIIPAVMVTALSGLAATAAPVAPLIGAEKPGSIAAPPPTNVQFRGGNWRDHPLMYPGNWWEHQRQWDAFEGRGPYARSPGCARFRSYGPGSHTYVNRSGRRVRCP
jgi:hypothetical protein